MTKNNRKITTPQSLNTYIKSICDIMRRSGRTGALQYVPELTWMLFLRILDEREQKEEEQAKALGIRFTPSLEYPYAGVIGHLRMERRELNYSKALSVHLCHSSMATLYLIVFVSTNFVLVDDL